MICRDGITKDRERTRALDIGYLAYIHAEIVEEGWLLNISRFTVPIIDITYAAGDLIPEWILFSKICIEAMESFRIECALHHLAQLIQGRPDITEKDIFAILVLTDRFRTEIDINSTGKRKCYY